MKQLFEFKEVFGDDDAPETMTVTRMMRPTMNSPQSW